MCSYSVVGRFVQVPWFGFCCHMPYVAALGPGDVELNMQWLIDALEMGLYRQHAKS